MDSNEARHSTAHYFLEGLTEIGFDYVFCNFGTDHAPLIEAMAAFRKAGRYMPGTILCPHENTAVHMAAGYAIATGRGQGVMVHVDAGTANAAMALHNLCRARIPVMLMAGKAPFTTRGELLGTRDTYVHFVQEPFDQASVVRPYTKWEYNLPSGVIAKEALRRAHTVMESDPKGPVYLTFPRETLTDTWSEGAIRSYPAERFGAVAARGVDGAAMETLATRLLAAERPLLITAYAGRNHATVAVLDELARFAGIRVVEFNPLYMNLPHDSPCHGGFMPAKALADADVGLLVDVDVPWIPSDMPDNPATWWAHIDVDAEKRAFPMWTFPGNLRLQGDSRRILSDLLSAVRTRADTTFRSAAAARVARLGEEARVRREQAARVAANRGTPGQINPHFLCAALAKALDPSAIVLNEAIRNGPVVFAQMPRIQPGTLVGLAGGGLGFSGGMALGLKLAQPERTVVQIVGDGTFYFSNPQSTLAVGRQYKLPVLTVVLDNAGWAAVKEATLRVYPEGDAKAAADYGAALAPDMDFAKVAEAAGAHGELVSDPDAVEPAVTRCLEALRSGRSAILHARVTKL
ncbi:thiamine pyrophosphate-requiring protein [Reyranella sp.]|jgi:acetolactate synthase-1/2/3 large subunit|uniref:thiamine pyrophosphate-requiring protein n=1 Tax=Reyranella sp. TaxID=1929291 RepID=UPI002F923546